MCEKKRCDWCGNDELYMAYHDVEWGVPVHDDARLFEFLILEGAQAGLSWLTVLRKRENYRHALSGFDAEKVAALTDAKLARLLKNPGIVRNRLKVHSHRANARAFCEIRSEFGSFDAYWWDWVDGRQVTNSFAALREIPSRTALSDRISKDLKKRGMSFVGSTIVYAMMQATGMVNDHLTGCFRYEQVRRLLRDSG